ncbi:MAG TPA: flavodoxin family protein [Syntrophorhabdales bacterium]|nr:flavodoxin family protein [Syntrophorhabdales bacterium]
MKTVILFGSPRKKGNTRRLVDAFSETMKKNGHDVRLLNLNDMNVRPCQGCLACAKEGKCRINDDMKDLRKYMMESELIVYATPTYWWGPSSQLKLVIDRSIVFFDENMDSRIKGKKVITLMTCADKSLDTFSPALDSFKRTFDALSMTYLGGVEAAGCEGMGEVSKKALEQTRKLAASLT